MKTRRCRECEEWYTIRDWEAQGDDFWIGGCELCGEHSASKCPGCGELNDDVWPYEEGESPLND